MPSSPLRSDHSRPAGAASEGQHRCLLEGAAEALAERGYVALTLGDNVSAATSSSAAPRPVRRPRSIAYLLPALMIGASSGACGDEEDSTTSTSSASLDVGSTAGQSRGEGTAAREKDKGEAKEDHSSAHDAKSQHPEQAELATRGFHDVSGQTDIPAYRVEANGDDLGGRAEEQSCGEAPRLSVEVFSQGRCPYVDNARIAASRVKEGAGAGFALLHGDGGDDYWLAMKGAGRERGMISIINCSSASRLNAVEVRREQCRC